MPMNVAVQMDPIETINIAGDSTFALMLEAQARGHRLFHYSRALWRCATGTLTADGPRRHGARREGRPLHARRRCAASISPHSTWC